MPNNDRPKVGQADAETRRKKLREILDGERDRPATKPTMKDAVDEGVERASQSETLPNGQKRRVGGKPKAKKGIVRRFGEKGETEEDMGL